MTINKKAAAIMLLFGGAPGLPAHADTRITPVEGMVYSVHTEETGGCPALDWHVAVGPKDTLAGMVSQQNGRSIWKVSGTYTADHTFHLAANEACGQQRTGSVDGEFRPDGSLALKLSHLSSPSPCDDKTIYVPWYKYRNGNAYDTNVGGGGGGG